MTSTRDLVLAVAREQMDELEKEAVFRAIGRGVARATSAVASRVGRMGSGAADNLAVRANQHVASSTAAAQSRAQARALQKIQNNTVKAQATPEARQAMRGDIKAFKTQQPAAVTPTSPTPGTPADQVKKKGMGLKNKLLLGGGAVGVGAVGMGAMGAGQAAMQRPQAGAEHYPPQY
jgi:hypothetical protein